MEQKPKKKKPKTEYIPGLPTGLRNPANAAKLRSVERAVEAGMSLAEACRMFQTSAYTIKQWRKERDEVRNESSNGI